MQHPIAASEAPYQEGILGISMSEAERKREVKAIYIFYLKCLHSKTPKENKKKVLDFYNQRCKELGVSLSEKDKAQLQKKFQDDHLLGWTPNTCECGSTNIMDEGGECVCQDCGLVLGQSLQGTRFRYGKNRNRYPTTTPLPKPGYIRSMERDVVNSGRQARILFFEFGGEKVLKLVERRKNLLEQGDFLGAGRVNTNLHKKLQNIVVQILEKDILRGGKRENYHGRIVDLLEGIGLYERLTGSWAKKLMSARKGYIANRLEETNGDISYSQIAKDLNISQDTISRYTSQLMGERPGLPHPKHLAVLLETQPAYLRKVIALVRKAKTWSISALYDSEYGKEAKQLWQRFYMRTRQKAIPHFGDATINNSWPALRRACFEYAWAKMRSGRELLLKLPLTGTFTAAQIAKEYNIDVDHIWLEFNALERHAILKKVSKGNYQVFRKIAPYIKEKISHSPLFVELLGEEHSVASERFLQYYLKLPAPERAPKDINAFLRKATNRKSVWQLLIELRACSLLHKEGMKKWKFTQKLTNAYLEYHNLPLEAPEEEAKGKNLENAINEYRIFLTRRVFLFKLVKENPQYLTGKYLKNFLGLSMNQAKKFLTTMISKGIVRMYPEPENHNKYHFIEGFPEAITKRIEYRVWLTFGDGELNKTSERILHRLFAAKRIQDPIPIAYFYTICSGAWGTHASDLTSLNNGIRYLIAKGYLKQNGIKYARTFSLKKKFYSAVSRYNKLLPKGAEKLTIEKATTAKATTKAPVRKRARAPKPFTSVASTSDFSSSSQEPAAAGAKE